MIYTTFLSWAITMAGFVFAYDRYHAYERKIILQNIHDASDEINKLCDEISKR